jgi:hypothetical protein
MTPNTVWPKPVKEATIEGSGPPSGYIFVIASSGRSQDSFGRLRIPYALQTTRKGA